MVVLSPQADLMRTLWGLDRDRRERLWHARGHGVQQQAVVEELELGGEQCGCECPVDVEELWLMLLTTVSSAGRTDTLCHLRCLSLWCCGSQVDDHFLGALAAAGCGVSLTSLTLCGGRPVPATPSLSLSLSLSH